MSLFVTGTDTGVGKTVVSALILARYAAELELAYWKPIATGSTTERDSATVAELAAAADSGVEVRLEMHLLRDPVSPHLAARREGVVIDLDEIAAAWAGWKDVSPERGVVVEGAGGVMVPLNERPRQGPGSGAVAPASEKQRLGRAGASSDVGGFGGSHLGTARSAGGELLIDLMALLELPVLLVARSALGTINHTLLSLDVLRRRGVPIAGVVLSGPRNDDNCQAIETYGDVRVLASVEPFELTPPGLQVAAAAFDPTAELRRYLLRA
jgi:dethiobiotin synthetase